MAKHIKKFKSVVFRFDEFKLIIENLPKFIIGKSYCVVIIKDTIIKTFSNELS